MSTIVKHLYNMSPTQPKLIAAKSALTVVIAVKIESNIFIDLLCIAGNVCQQTLKFDDISYIRAHQFIHSFMTLKYNSKLTATLKLVLSLHILIQISFTHFLCQ